MILKYATQATDIQNDVSDVKNVNKLKMNLCLSFWNQPTTYYDKPETYLALFATLKCSLPLHTYCEVLTQKSQALNMWLTRYFHLLTRYINDLHNQIQLKIISYIATNFCHTNTLLPLRVYVLKTSVKSSRNILMNLISLATVANNFNCN